MTEQVTNLTVARLTALVRRAVWSRTLPLIQTSARQFRVGLREKLILAFLLVVIISVGSLSLVALYLDTLKSILVVFLLVAGVALLVAASLADMITLPVRELTREVKAIAAGNLGVEVSVGSQDEIGELGRAFNEMAAQLRESYDALRREQRKALAAIDASVDGIWVDYQVGDECQLIMINSALERMSGRRREDLVGRPCKYLMKVRTVEEEPICDTVCPFLHPEEERSGFVEGFIPTAQGEVIPIEIGYGRILDEKGTLIGAVHVVRDLTARKEVEQLKDEFISMVSHELWAPLNHIKGFTSTLLQRDVVWDATARHDFLESIDRETDRLTKLVEDLLRISRLEAGELEVTERHWHQASSLLERALARIQPETEKHRLKVRVSDDLPPVLVDGDSIELVLINLVENATKYSEPGTLITIQVEPGDEGIVFSVTDHGIGIGQEHLERVFERFYRVDASSTGGTGLGLAICKRIVEAHGGCIWADSTPGKGSCFSFALPVKPEGCHTG